MMRSYRGQYLQVFLEVRDYGGDLFNLGRETAAKLVKEIYNRSGTRDPFLPRLAFVLFTQTDDSSGDSSGAASEPLNRLCVGLNEGLGPVPLIGCSVAAIPSLETHRIHTRGFSITLLAARKKDFAATVGGSCGFIDEEKGHEKAWTECLSQIDRQETEVGMGGGLSPEDGFVLAFFPGLVEGALDFKARNPSSFRFLRSRISPDFPIYGAGAGDNSGSRQCLVMAGRELISNGYVCAKIRTTLQFKLSMDQNLKMASERLLVKELKKGSRGRTILSFAQSPGYKTVKVDRLFPVLQKKYETKQFVFRTVEFDEESENLLFLSVDYTPSDRSLDLVGPVREGALIRPAFADTENPLFSRAPASRLLEDVPVAVFFPLICQGIFRLLGGAPVDRDAVVLQQLEHSIGDNLSTAPPIVAGFVFGEWGLGPAMNGQAQNYHVTMLAIADALTPRHHQRRQLEVIDHCSNKMLAALLKAEASEQGCTVRRAAGVLAGPLFEAIEDLGYNGGLISLVREVDQMIVGVEAYGEPWQKVKESAVVRLDEHDLLVQVYRAVLQQKTEHHVPDCAKDAACTREARAGIVSQTLFPLWDGSRCLGILQVGHSLARIGLPDHESNALSAIAQTAALHLRRIKTQEAIRGLDEAVRFAVATDDQAEGWQRLAQAAARAVEVPSCTIRVLDGTDKFLELVGGTQELFKLTVLSGRLRTSVEKGLGPVAHTFRHLKSQGRQGKASPEVFVQPDVAKDVYHKEIAGTSPELTSFFQRVGSYALASLVSPHQGLVGIISFLAPSPGFFTPEKKELVQKIASDASVVAKVYRSVQRENWMLETTLSLNRIQAEVDKILRSVERSKEDFQAAARLLVTETLKILPCEACTLHRFEERRFLRLQAAAPDEGIHKRREWDTFEPKDHGFLLHLASQRDIYRAAGDKLRSHPRIREKTGVWEWLPKTKKLHSILAIPLVDPNGRNYGLLTLYNQLNREEMPDDALDFSNVHTQVRNILKEIATHVLESLESRSRFAGLDDLAAEFQAHVDCFISSTTYPNRDEIFCELAASLAKWLGAQICSIFLLKQPEGQLVLRGCYGWETRKQMLRRACYSSGEGLTGTLLQKTEPEVVPSIFDDKRRTGKYFAEMYGPPDSDRTYEMIALPLWQGQEPLGIVTVYRKLPLEFSHLLGFNERDRISLKLASQLVRLAVAAIEGEPQTEEALEYERPAIAEILSVAGQERLRTLDYNQLAERIAQRFQASLCGIFLTYSHNQASVTLRGASEPLRRFVEKIQIAKYQGIVGETFALQTTQFQDLAEELSFIGPLDHSLRESLYEPLQNMVAAPMRLGEECEGVILLVNRTSLASSEQKAKTLPKYHLEALGTGILLVRRNIEYSSHLQKFKETIAEHRNTAELASMALDLAHAFSGPLHRITTTLSTLRKSTLDLTTKDSCIARIESECLSVNKIIHNILKNNSTGEAKPFELAEVVRRAVEINSAAADERRINIVHEGLDYVQIRTSRTQLVGVVSTILENAIEACERDVGEVRITLERSIEHEMIGLAITDNGSGISPENMRRVFARGFSTKDRMLDRERGYGLHIAKILLLFQGGDIEAASSPGGGTCMTIWLPGDLIC